MKLKRNFVLSLLLCLMLMLLPSTVLLAQSELPPGWQLTQQELFSLIGLDRFYSGSEVRFVLSEVFKAADEAIDYASTRAAEKASADVYRVVIPEREGWKVRAVETGKQLKLARQNQILVGVLSVLGGIITGFTLGVIVIK